MFAGVFLCSLLSCRNAFRRFHFVAVLLRSSSGLWIIRLTCFSLLADAKKAAAALAAAGKKK
jgi:hypothetical protein